MKTTVRQNTETELDSFRNLQPMKVAEKWRQVFLYCSAAAVQSACSKFSAGKILSRNVAVSSDGQVLHLR